MTARDEWRWTDDRGVQRLVGTDELRAALTSALLPGTTLVWREGMKEWKTAATMPELADAVAQAPKGQTAPGRASLVGVLEALAQEDANGASPPRPKVSPAGPLKLPAAPAKRPQAPGLSPRAARHTLIGGTGPEPQKASGQSAPIVVPSPSALRVAITQIPQQGTPARIDALEIPRAPGLPQTGEKPRAAPQRKMTTREIDGDWAPSAGELADEDATNPQMARPTREYGVHGAAPASPAAASTSEAKPAAEKTSAALKPAPATASATAGLAPRPSGPTMTAPAKAAAAAPARPALHRPPVATRPSKIPPAMPGAAPFVFPAAPATPAPFAVAASTTSAGATTSSAALEARGEARAGIADPKTEELDEPAAALPAVTAAPPQEVATREAESAEAAHAAAQIVAPPPPLPRGVTITTTALFPPPMLQPPPTPQEPSGGQMAARATHPSFPPPLAPEQPPPLAPEQPPPHVPEQRPTALSRPPPPSIDPVRVAPKLAPIEPALTPPPPSAAPRSAVAAAAVAAERARAERAQPAMDAAPLPPPPSTSLNGPVAVPVGSLYGAGGALICMVVTAFFAGRCSAQAPPQLARPSLQAIPALARAAIPPPPKACWVTRQPVMWAPRASKTIPFEVTATTAGALAIGYARDANEAMGIVVSPSTGEVKAAFAKQSEEEIDRVTPSSSAEFRLVTSPKEGALSSVIPVAAAAPFVVGVQSGSIVTADREGAATSPLWPLAGSEAPSSARVLIAAPSGYAVVYRREGAIWSGWIGPDRKAVGDLVKVAGSGGQVGKPNIGWNRRELALIFADKPAGSDHYEIRVAHAKTGSIPTVTSVIPLPKGGPGGDAFAPDIAGLPDGRWVMVWTEGAAGSRAIRAQTFTRDFTPLGDPIALSPPAGNFGQGMLGVVGDYAAAVFLSKGASSYELWGSVLQCG